MLKKILISFPILLVLGTIFFISSNRPTEKAAEKERIIPTITPSPTPFMFTTYTPPKIERKEVYKIAMIGDSMTAALGPHGGGMSEYLESIYKESGSTNQRIIIDNYAVSSSILAVDNQITKEFSINEYKFGPLIEQDYDVILIESFGYNPLSEFGMEEGLLKQTLSLDNLMERLIRERPNAVIIFVATIAPSLKSYGQSTQPNSTVEDRRKRAEERVAYIKNHIHYANTHGIPLINIYEKSLNSEGDGDTKYINADDDIHPSAEGVVFIGKEIGKYISENQILIK